MNVSEAVDILRGAVKKITEVEEISLWDACGRILAEDIYVSYDQPPFDKSPLDGYAVRGADLAGASKETPVSLTVLEEVDAGDVPEKEVLPGTATRIMTGAMMPAGADCVIRQEDTDYGEVQAMFYDTVSAGKNVCFRGEDMRKGELLLGKGSLLTATNIGILSGDGHAQVKVLRKPVLAVLTTGSEVQLPGEPLKPGKVYDVNLHTLCAGLAGFGAEVLRLGLVEDAPEKAAELLRAATEKADVIITTGGVSVGKKDIMHDVFRLMEVERLFWKIRMKPGSPVLAGMYQGKLILCLSGNPYGVFAGMHLFVREILAALTGDESIAMSVLQAELTVGFAKGSKVPRYVRGIYQNGSVRPSTGLHTSGGMGANRESNCLIEMAGQGPTEAGTMVKVLLF